ncbi:MAG: hypothetical protein VX498_08195 [Myxococcota bacterium]|nr:hypothetical protein [Myxococcota bacterium]
MNECSWCGRRTKRYGYCSPRCEAESRLERERQRAESAVRAAQQRAENAAFNRRLKEGDPGAWVTALVSWGVAAFVGVLIFATMHKEMDFGPVASGLAALVGGSVAGGLARILMDNIVAVLAAAAVIAGVVYLANN